jgi:hypothetical protein
VAIWLRTCRKPLEEINFKRARTAKVFAPTADLPGMVNPVSSANASQVSVTAKAAAPKPQPPQQQGTQQPSDKVTLKSAGDANHDGDSK